MEVFYILPADFKTFKASAVTKGSFYLLLPPNRPAISPPLVLQNIIMPIRWISKLYKIIIDYFAGSFTAKHISG
jgi:hypothetical protein